MYKKLNILAYLLCLATFAQAQNSLKPNVFLDGILENSPDAEINVYNLINDALIQTVDLRDGRFHFETYIAEPTPFRLESRPAFPTNFTIFLEKGKMKLRKATNGPHNFIVDGSYSHKDFQNFSAVSNRFMIAYQNLADQLENKKISQAQFETELENVSTGYKTIVLEFIKSHPDRYVASLIAYEHIKSMTYELNYSERASMFDKLGPFLMESSYGKKIKAQLEAEQATTLNHVLPDFQLPDTSGRLVALSAFKGKYILLDFWASWCVPCKAENQHLIRAFEEYHEDPFDIVSISLDTDKKQWLEAIEKEHLTKWSHLSEIKGWTSELLRTYNINSIPSNFLLDPDGKIISKNLRGVELENTLKTILKK